MHFLGALLALASLARIGGEEAEDGGVDGFIERLRAEAVRAYRLEYDGAAEDVFVEDYVTRSLEDATRTLLAAKGYDYEAFLQGEELAAAPGAAADDDGLGLDAPLLDVSRDLTTWPVRGGGGGGGGRARTRRRRQPGRALAAAEGTMS